MPSSRPYDTKQCSYWYIQSCLYIINTVVPLVVKCDPPTRAVCTRLSYPRGVHFGHLHSSAHTKVSINDDKLSGYLRLPNTIPFKITRQRVVVAYIPCIDSWSSVCSSVGNTEHDEVNAAKIRPWHWRRSVEKMWEGGRGA